MTCEMKIYIAMVGVPLIVWIHDFVTSRIEPHPPTRPASPEGV